MSESDQDRLVEIEQRLAKIEMALGLKSNQANDTSMPGSSTPRKAIATSEPIAEPDAVEEAIQPATLVSTPDAAVRLKPQASPPIPVVRQNKISPATVMAWGACASFILATAYFLGLLVTSGWLTPPIQLLIATSVGLGLIVSGIGLSRYDRAYASYLPAVGMIVLYLTVYAGQLFHHLLTPLLSSVLVCFITAGAIALGRLFNREIYGICAVVGVYISPLLLHTGTNSSTVMLFYAMWGIAFCTLSVQSGSRNIYLLAVYLAMFSFDAACRLRGDDSWVTHAAFQFAQFLMFSFTAALIAIRIRVPMTKSEAIAHAPPLFYFYFLEYALLKVHAPTLIPAFALISVVAVVGGYAIARKRLNTKGAEAGATLISSFASIVVAHVIFFELLPWQWLPWGALALALVTYPAFRRFGLSHAALIPVWIVAGVICLAGCTYALTDALRGSQATSSAWILPVYGTILYGVFYRLRISGIPDNTCALSLYAGHFAMMVAAIRILDNQLLISIAWGLMAVALLLIAWKARIAVLGQSSLFIFAVSAIKVVIYDLSGSPPAIRIGTLLILAVSLYFGGWIYQKLDLITMRHHPDDDVNDHIQMVLRLSQEGMTSEAIAQQLRDREPPCLASDGWTEVLVNQILTSHAEPADSTQTKPATLS